MLLLDTINVNGYYYNLKEVGMPKLAKQLIAKNADDTLVTVQLWTGFPGGRSAVVLTHGPTVSSSISMGARKASTRYNHAITGLTALADTTDLPQATCCGEAVPYAAPWCQKCHKPIKENP